MTKPLLIIVNGLPASGKTALASRLGKDLQLPVLARDKIFETLYDALEGQDKAVPDLLGAASFKCLYSFVETLLAANQNLVAEGFFGRPELRSAEFEQIQQCYPFQPFQILCHADGKVLLNRFLARLNALERHQSHQDLEWLAQNKERILQGALAPLTIGGQVIEIDTTSHDSFDYNKLIQQIRTFL